jgi:hypothetical protein
MLQPRRKLHSNAVAAGGKLEEVAVALPANRLRHHHDARHAALRDNFTHCTRVAENAQPVGDMAPRGLVVVEEADTAHS